MSRIALALTVAGAALLVMAPSMAGALQPGPDDVYVRVVDVGPALCTVTEIPGQHYMVYDAGHWQGSNCLQAVQHIVDGEEIDLLVISHGDADHLGEADNILGAYQVKRIIRTGELRASTNWSNANKAIGKEAESGASIMNLQTVDLVPGTMIELAEARITLVAGWGEWEGTGPTDPEMHNVISIVVRLAYRGNSVLFTGDTIGRRLIDPDSACKDAEKFMFENSVNVPIRSDVLIAPHHGGNNGSSNCFIEAVDPTFVIFSAGSVNNWGHPRQSTVNRYLTHGLSSSNLFRTDRGDDEPGDSEWKNDETVADCNDGRGDDDVEILLPDSGGVQVAYKEAAAGC